MVRNLIVLAVLIACAIGFFIFTKSRNQSSDTLTLYKDSGSIMYKENSGNYTSLDSDKKTIPNHSFIKTGEDGLAHVILPDKSMLTLDVNTEMQVNYSSSSTKILQSLGQVWYRVKKIAGATEDFSVETGTMVATVRGTIFVVKKDVEDTVYVRESSVEIAQLKDDNGKKVKENIETLTENKLANIGGIDKGAPKIIDIPDDIKESQWFKRNEIIDNEFKNNTSTDDLIKKIRDEMPTASVSGSSSNKFSDYSWLQNGQNACSYINGAEYTNMIDEIKSSQAVYGAWGDWLIKGVDMARAACKDGAINESEMKSLQDYFKTAPAPNITMPANY